MFSTISIEILLFEKQKKKKHSKGIEIWKRQLKIFFEYLKINCEELTVFIFI